jgi:Methylamine utilisation protein MauE
MNEASDTLNNEGLQINESSAVSASPRLPVSDSSRPRVSASPRLAVFFKWLVRISRFGLAALFLFTAIAKLAVIRGFVDNVGQLLTGSGFDSARWSWPATIAVIAIEFLIAILLLVPKTVRIGAVAAAALLTFFAGYALYYVYGLQGEPLECGCFGGIIASQLGVSTALRNLCLLIPAFIVWFGYRRPE